MAGPQSHTRRSKTILFDRYVTPFLTEHGFVRDRRTYRRFNDLGDCVMVELQPSGAATRYEYVFYVNLYATPRLWMDYVGTPDPTRPAPTGPVSWRLRRNVDPEPWQSEVLRQTAQHIQTASGESISGLDVRALLSTDRWTIGPTPESAEECGHALTRTLTAELPNLTSLLDRDTFLRRLRGQQPPPIHRPQPPLEPQPLGRTVDPRPPPRPALTCHPPTANGTSRPPAGRSDRGSPAPRRCGPAGGRLPRWSP
ncbi:MAG TPA: DUF4304 domain-containing protein [Micromonosporaceae bacterium]|nr:DUF4304 domain-containing protein [Micromonosporaceae bacterium]